VSFVEPFDEPSPLRRALNATEVASSLIAARWRAIVLLFILGAAVWLVLEAFFALHDAYVSVRENVPQLNEISSRIAPKFSLSPPPITNCWRDRSLAAGECFRSTGAVHSPPEHPRAPPRRLRFPECRRCTDI
jgi:hypothetical protein